MLFFLESVKIIDDACAEAHPTANTTHLRRERCHGGAGQRNGKDRFALQAAGVCLSGQRNLRGFEWVLGLWATGRAAEEQHSRLLVAEHGGMSAHWAGRASG